MCGIAGYYGKNIPSNERLNDGLFSIKHRGPDGEGVYTKAWGERSVAFIHRRLAILDLEKRSDQPFRLKNNVLIFNGEIYNYIEVRRELLSIGHSFITDGDTEVLAHALEEWGEAALDKLEGMWAFAWYNEESGELLLCRDRFGEKPLYIWPCDNGIYFASEIKAIAALAGKWPSINENHLIRYLINGYKALYKVKETFYLGVEELPIASYVKLNGGSKAVQKYWEPTVAVIEEMSYKEAVAGTREAMINAVRLRMRSDVPLSFCMSGGIDSNSLIAIAKRELNCDVHGFTIVNSDARYEEQDMVMQVVNELGIRHTSVQPQQDSFLDDMRGLVRSHDGPVSTISYYVHWKLMKAVAEAGYKVSISGTGADELFTGYYDHHNLYLYEVANNPEVHRKSLEAWKKYQADIVRNPFLQNPDLYIQDPSFRGHVFLNNDIFEGYLHKQWHEDFTEENYGYGLLRNRMLNELFVEGTRVILHEDDLNAMDYSIENRSPFLDRKLFEMAYSIPVEYLIQNGLAKSVLREAMRGIVPDIILDNRRKVGFNAPILDLLDINDPSVRTFLLDDSDIFKIVQKDKIESLLNRKDLPNSYSKFLFNFINAKLFIDQKSY